MKRTQQIVLNYLCICICHNKNQKKVISLRGSEQGTWQKQAGGKGAQQGLNIVEEMREIM